MEEYIAVLTPEGERKRVPIRNKEKALRLGFQLVTPESQPLSAEEYVSVITPEGAQKKVPAKNLEKALSLGFKLAEDSQSNAEVGAKALASGALSLLDLPQNLASIFPGKDWIREEGYSDVKPAKFIQTLPPNILSNAIKSKLKDYTNIDLNSHPTTDTQRIIKHAGEFAGGAGPLGAFSKGIKAINVAKSAAAGAATGTLSGGLQEAGVNPLVADIGASVVAPYSSKSLLANFKKLPENIAKIPLKAMGLSGKTFNLKTAQAARDLGIDLPAAALTESKLTNLAEQYVGKVPFLGDKIKNKYATVEAQTKAALDKIYNEVGPEGTPEIKKLIDQLYNERRKALPLDAEIKPSNLKAKLAATTLDTDIPSPNEKRFLKTLDSLTQSIEPHSKYTSPHGVINVPLQPYSVKKLIGNKISLSDVIPWNEKLGITGQQIEGRLKGVRKAITQDVEAYGKTNPEWYTKYQKADKLYSDVAKREELENLLTHNTINHATDSFSYNALAKAINNPTAKKHFQKRLTPEVRNKIENLGEVAKALAIKTKNIPNPSGTAPVHAAATVVGATLIQPFTMLPALGGGFIGAELLTNKKYLDLALKFAENPHNKHNVMALTNLITKLTGYSPIILQREINREHDGST